MNFDASERRGVSNIPLSGIQPDDNHALQSFDFRFANGDHHIQQIRLLKGTNQISAAFKDQDDGDPWNLTGCYVRVPGTPGSVEFTMEDGRATWVDIPGLNSNMRFALSGFDFDFGSGDQHIRVVLIMPSERQGGVLVNFNDKIGGNETVRGTLQFVLVPADQVASDYRQAGDNFDRGNNRTMVPPQLGGPSERVLSGFSFIYLHRTDGGDAHLLRLGVDLPNHTVQFQDNDMHEIIQWKVDYFSLR
ncbi:hypothetical protein QWY75_00155 [Pontixanthobacter aestiaquae]|uniref:Uncharacterized protein n=1 Tax=Pontixanthobacter aestiaquae TaxID=1509367 RepID=A0A844ZB95_9SPHN|nr:hypothetical protein [Pontixanthobacter aestiaquae]MDN3644610.1 hypothetical protein [Pontixanthobacter aestiaquae]MXO84383.1 hypothetical protein [Pontixanthobacter aestiaquae]